MQLFQPALQFAAAYPLFSVVTIISVVWLLSVYLLSFFVHRNLRRLTPTPNEFANLPGAAKRYWDHAKHEDKTVGNRLSFFLVFESILFGVFATVYLRSSVNDIPLLNVIAAAGLTVTLIWAYIQVRHRFILDAMRPRMIANFDEYAETLRWRALWPFHGGWLLNIGLPFVATLLWLSLFIVVANITSTVLVRP